MKADAGIAFAGASHVEAASGNVYQPSAAVHTYGTVAFSLTGDGFVHATVPADAVGRHDSDSAVYAAGFLTKDEDGRIVLDAGNRIVDPAGAAVVSYRDPDMDVTSAYIARADGVDAGDVTVAVSREAKLAIEPTALSFSATAGYSDVTAQRLTLTNAGDVALRVSADPLELFVTDLPNGLELQPGQSVAVAVKPVAGLGAGSHSEKLAFSSTEGARASADAAFQVAPAPAPQPTPAPPTPHRGTLAATGDGLGSASAALAALAGLGLLAAGVAARALRARRAPPRPGAKEKGPRSWPGSGALGLSAKRKRPGRARRPSSHGLTPQYFRRWHLTAGFGMGPGDPTPWSRSQGVPARGFIWPRPAAADPPRHPGGCTALVTSRSRNRECVCEKSSGY